MPPPGDRWSEEVTSDAPHVHVVQQRHDAKAQPHTRGEEPAELNHHLQDERDALGLSRCSDRDCLEDEDRLVEPAPPGACVGSRRSSDALHPALPSRTISGTLASAPAATAATSARIGRVATTTATMALAA